MGLLPRKSQNLEGFGGLSRIEGFMGPTRLRVVSRELARDFSFKKPTRASSRLIARKKKGAIESIAPFGGQNGFNRTSD